MYKGHKYEDKICAFAIKVLQQRKCIGNIGVKFGTITNMYTRAREAAMVGANLEDTLAELHKDGLQFPGHEEVEFSL